MKAATFDMTFPQAEVLYAYLRDEHTYLDDVQITFTYAFVDGQFCPDDLVYAITTRVGNRIRQWDSAEEVVAHFQSRAA